MTRAPLAQRLAAGIASAGLVAVLALAGGTTLPAPALATERGEPGGTEVTGGNSVDDAAEIEPGSYADEISYEDVDFGENHPASTYRISLEDGQSGYVSASMLRPEDAGSDAFGAAELEITVAAPADPSCSVSQSSRVSGNETGPVSVSISTGVLDGNNPNDSCFQRGGSFIVSVAWSETYDGLPQTLPLELQYVRQAATAWSQLPEPEENPAFAEFLPESRGEAETLSPGWSFNTATELTEADAIVDAEVGRPLFFRAPLSTGQQLSLRARAASPADHTLTLRVFDPNLRPVAVARPGDEGAPASDMPDANGTGTDASISIADSGGTTALTTRYPVNPRHEFVEFDDAKASSIAGDYYIVVTIEPPLIDDPATGTHQVRLSWESQGEPFDPAPEVEGAGAAPSYLGMELGTWVRIGGLGLGSVFLAIAGLLAILAIRRARR